MRTRVRRAYGNGGQFAHAPTYTVTHRAALGADVGLVGAVEWALENR